MADQENIKGEGDKGEHINIKVVNAVCFFLCASNNFAGRQRSLFQNQKEHSIKETYGSLLQAPRSTVKRCAIFF